MNRIALSASVTFSLITSLFLSGCTTQTGYNKQKPLDLVSITLNASKPLSKKAKVSLSDGATILSTSLSDINIFNSTSALGRLISEQLSSRLVDQGFQLKEIKMRNTVFISQKKVVNFLCLEG